MPCWPRRGNTFIVNREFALDQEQGNIPAIEDRISMHIWLVNGKEASHH
jgi:hypothetical protein